MAFILMFLTGCVNPYAQFYRPNPGFEDARRVSAYDHSVKGLQILSTSDFERDGTTLLAKSYWPIGYSSFNAGANLITETHLRKHAETIGAHVVLLNSRFSHTVQGAVPVQVPQTSTTYSTGNASAYGSGGFATAYGSGTSTTYSSQTVLMPYSVNRYDVNAMFYAKVQHRLGIVVFPLTDAERTRLGTNSALRVHTVVEGSPAFLADVLPADYVLSLGGKPTYSVDAFSQLLIEFQGSDVELVLRRGDTQVRKTVAVRRVP